MGGLEMKCYLFDIDGTLADLTHRLPHIQKEPKDWDAFFAACRDDRPIEHIVDLVHALSHFDHIVLVSGRSDRVKRQTKDWLREHLINYDALYMRRDGDHRPDNQVKAELLDRLLADGYKPRIVFEDRDQVVQMWRARGIPCAQVADGNF
jgi:phosphoglycolate phosphatase-like HAD superfamily hydrolase